MYIISGCLLGENCKYNGGNNFTDWVVEFANTHSYISVCPEVLGGLKSPRAPVEILGGRAINCEGLDVTAEFEKGCKLVWEISQEKAIALGEKIEGAILKAKSPSCGSNTIYDGSFSHTIIEGNGFLVQLLKDKGIKIVSENDDEEDLL
jgi:uncharacterized protein YbbK (DUF523 family)